MKFRLWSVVLVLLLILVGVLYIFQSGLLGLSRQTTASSIAPASSVSTESARGYRFVQSVNALGDRIYLRTNATITLTPNPTSPDAIAIAPSGGTRSGTFTFVVTPHQGRRGVRRVSGEFELNGQAFAVCEAVDDPAGDVPLRAQRFAPINNVGSRTALPVTIPGEPLLALLNAVTANTNAAGTSFSPSSETIRLAESLIGVCTR